ncbi:Carbonic anhydrase [Diplonema papillatum]|nr:Carbonic anhydrase [Diplonema papillatum]
MSQPQAAGAGRKASASGKDAPTYVPYVLPATDEDAMGEENIDRELDESTKGVQQEWDPELNKILQNNKEWVDHTNTHHPGFFKMMAAGQSPHYLYVGCSDARVNPGQLMGLKQDEIFVHRNVGNLCPNDLNFLSVLEYAVNFLHVPHIIVCGHYDCGAVRNSVKKQDIGLLENWIRNIRDVQRLHAGELNKITCTEGKHRRLVELNVIEQCINIFKTSAVQQHRLKTANDPDRKYPFSTPRIHALVFDPADGILKKLDINWEEECARYQHIYDLC